MSKPVSCGILVLSGESPFSMKVLVGMSTGNGKYDIPKGQMEEGERHIDAAIRECKEETGLEFTEKDLTFLGKFAYSQYKDLVLYATFVPSSAIDVDKLVCESTFKTKDGRELPELSEFMWMRFSDYEKYLFKSMQKVFSSLSIDLI